MLAVAASRQAQSQWVVIRDRGKPRAQHERERAGIVLRSEISAACRWNLRHDRAAQAVLDDIARGQGVADLIQDLLTLAALLDRHESAFDPDETFDAPAHAEAARSAAEEITAGLSESRLTADRDAAKDLRDRAYTHLTKLVSALRDAGRYAFRREPQRAAAFGSEYQRRAHARARRRATSRAQAAVRVETAAEG